MKEEVKLELLALAKKLAPEIEKRFTSKEDQRLLREYLIGIGAGNVLNFTLKVVQTLENYDLVDKIPPLNVVESALYEVLSSFKAKKGFEFTSEMDRTNARFLKIFCKIFLSAADINSEEVVEANDVLNRLIYSMAENEGIDPKEILDELHRNNIKVEDFFASNLSLDDVKKVKLANAVFNVRIVTDKPHFLFLATYREILSIADAMNLNAEVIRVSGDVFNINAIKSIKIFTVTDPIAVKNELHLSGRLILEAKQAYNIGEWTYESFLRFGDDVTGIFLKPMVSKSIKKTEINPIDIPSLIQNGENKCVEFKSRLTFDAKTNAFNKNIENGILQTIGAFLNSEGGTLLIGVNDNKTINGLESDLNMFNDEDKKDKLALYFDNMIASAFGSQVSKSVTFSYFSLEGKIIGVVRVKKSKVPIFFNNKLTKNSEFYIRRNVSTVKIDGQALLEYTKEF